MPRKRVVNDQILNAEETLALPAPRVTTHKHHEHEIDPYMTPPGAVPAKVTNASETQKPLNRKPTKADLQARELAKAEMQARAARYNQYLDIMMANGGDQVTALAAVFNVSQEEAQVRHIELLADVRNGIGSTELGAILANNDLDLTARARVLKKHLFSDNPAASLKAADMIGELEGKTGNTGSFEDFLRIVKRQGP